jgi:hypothetical protein
MSIISLPSHRCPALPFPILFLKGQRIRVVKESEDVTVTVTSSLPFSPNFPLHVFDEMSHHCQLEDLSTQPLPPLSVSGNSEMLMNRRL